MIDRETDSHSSRVFNDSNISLLYLTHLVENFQYKIEMHLITFFKIKKNEVINGQGDKQIVILNIFCFLYKMIYH